MEHIPLTAKPMNWNYLTCMALTLTQSVWLCKVRGLEIFNVLLLGGLVWVIHKMGSLGPMGGRSSIINGVCKEHMQFDESDTF